MQNIKKHSLKCWDGRDTNLGQYSAKMQNSTERDKNTPRYNSVECVEYKCKTYDNTK